MWHINKIFGTPYSMDGQKGIIMAQFLNFDDRIHIQMDITQNIPFSQTAAKLSCHSTTIAREVKNNSVTVYGNKSLGYNSCIHRNSCSKIKVCGDACSYSSNRKCHICGRCRDMCPDFKEEFCMVTAKAPYVCNGCEKFGTCTLVRRTYDAQKAQQLADERISASRSGILNNPDNLERMNKLISPLIGKGQSIHDICVNNMDQLMCSERTIYNYIDAGDFDVKNIDLLRKVTFRQKKKETRLKIDKNCRVGRGYNDFDEYCSKHPDAFLTQMDTVIGTVGGKSLLTLLLVDSGILLAFLKDSNTSQFTIDTINMLNRKLGDKVFDKLFPVILTDNGSEFSNPKAIEYRPGKSSLDLPECRTRIFYCDPNRPQQKGAIEVCHEFIRRFIPKGKGFDDLTQHDVDTMVNHINSYARPKFGDRSPYEMGKLIYGKDVLKLLEITSIPPNEVTLKARLFKK